MKENKWRDDFGYLNIVNSYRLTMIQKYIIDRKEEFLNSNNRKEIIYYHYKKLLDDLVDMLSEIPTKEFIENYYEPKTRREWDAIDFIDRYLALDLDEFNSKSLLNKIKQILEREK